MRGRPRGRIQTEHSVTCRARIWQRSFSAGLFTTAETHSPGGWWGGVQEELPRKAAAVAAVGEQRGNDLRGAENKTRAEHLEWDIPSCRVPGTGFPSHRGTLAAAAGGAGGPCPLGTAPFPLATKVTFSVRAAAMVILDGLHRRLETSVATRAASARGKRAQGETITMQEISAPQPCAALAPEIGACGAPGGVRG
ncbi:unnamed protein product [Lampetra planeri]